MPIGPQLYISLKYNWFVKNKILLIILVLLALSVRLIYFKESVYFGWDEARDAFMSQAIYKNLQLKLIGPPANAPGLFHGPLHWYLIGPLYLIASGNPYIVNIAFRIINALGVIAVFFIAKEIFGKRAGYIAAILFAFSFEQTQYAMYMGNPAWAVWSWLVMGIGTALLYKKNKWGFILLWAGAAGAVQFELMEVNALLSAAVVTYIFRKQINLKYSFKSVAAVLIFLSTYILAEFKFGFRSIKSALSLVQSGYNIIPAGQSKWTLWLTSWTQLFKDNIIPTEKYLIPAAGLFLLAIAYLSYKDKKIRSLWIWILAGLWLLPLGVYNAYYANVGIGIGFILAGAVVIDKIWSRSAVLAVITVLLIVSGNLIRIYAQAPQSLILGIKAQPGMTLNDETKLIDRIYQISGGNGFTVRATSMPYKIQTTWAYLFEQYGKKKYGYLPYWENGNVLDYPGTLPGPVNGTTCLRFSVIEPIRGIPENLIGGDQKEENYFSNISSTENFGKIILQIRLAKDPKCHSLPAK